MPLLKQYLYVSECTVPRDEAGAFRTAITEILASSQRNNQVEAITGALAYDRGRFVQLFEGPLLEADDLMDRLLIDARHNHVEVRLARRVNRRLFPHWSMAFVNPRATPLSGNDASDLRAAQPESLLAWLNEASRAATVLTTLEDAAAE